MGGAYQSENLSIAPSQLDSKTRVISLLPAASRTAPVPTYAGQLMPGHYVLAKLANPEALADQVLHPLKEEIELISLEREQLGAELKRFTERASARAQLFLNYLSAARPGTLYLIREKAGRGISPSSQEITLIASSAYHLLRVASGAKSAIKTEIADYIKTGRLSDTALDFLSHALKGTCTGDVFVKLKRHKEFEPSALASMDDWITGEIEGIISGRQVQPVERSFLGISLNPYKSLEGIAGALPHTPFFIRLAEKPEAESARGITEIVKYVPGETEAALPQELKSGFIQAKSLTQLITVLDRGIRIAFGKYINSTPELLAMALQTSTDMRYSLSVGAIVRGLMPDGHEPSRMLYPDSRILSEDRQLIEPARVHVRNFVETLKKRIPEIQAFCETEFKIERGSVDIESIIRLQECLMYFAPFQIYQIAAIHDKMTDHFRNPKLRSMTLQEAKKSRPVLNSVQKKKLGQIESLEAELGQHFGLSDSTEVFEIGEETVDSLVSLFGSRFSFLGPLLFSRA